MKEGRRPATIKREGNVIVRTSLREIKEMQRGEGMAGEKGGDETGMEIEVGRGWGGGQDVCSCVSV